MTAEPHLTDMRVLVADDNADNAELLVQILTGAGYTRVEVTRQADRVVPACESGERPDLLILDLHMPGLSGYEILGQLRPGLVGPPYMPVLVVTADVTPEARRRALSLGATDFLTKPVDPLEVLLRTHNLLRAHHLQSSLNTLVEERTAELDLARYEVLERLARAAEYRDDDTGEHVHRVGRSAGLIAAQLTPKSPAPQLIAAAACLHDVGKIGIPDEILLKPAPLTADERDTMKRHVEIGAQILGGADSPHMRLAYEIALRHHERWDGAGYPDGLAGDAIPLSARITSVADVLDALTHSRPYKDPWPLDRALKEIRAGAGSQFDPDVVAAFMRLDHVDLVELPATARRLQAGLRGADLLVA